MNCLKGFPKIYWNTTLDIIWGDGSSSNNIEVKKKNASNIVNVPLTHNYNYTGNYSLILIVSNPISSYTIVNQVSAIILKDAFFKHITKYHRPLYSDELISNLINGSKHLLLFVLLK